MTIKPQIQAKILHISIIVLLLLSIIFLSVGYSIAETQGMTSCALNVPGFIELRETYGFKNVQVKVCFEGSGGSSEEDGSPSNNTFASMCNPGRNFPWCDHRSSAFAASCLVLLFVLFSFLFLFIFYLPLILLLVFFHSCRVASRPLRVPLHY